LGFQGLTGLAAGTFGYFATDSSGNVRLAIEADVSANKAKILSAPHILVSDNKEARIQVGKQVPIATSSTSTPITAGVAATNTTTSTIQYKDVGTILKVKPQINDSGLIALEISQEVSDSQPVDVLGTTQLQIIKNEVTTNLVAQDGETIVIGGLVNENDTFTNSGIPLLSTIPVLKYLFGTNTTSKERHEIVILLTPHVVRNQDEARKMTSDYYEIFKNVSKEINIEKHKKSTNTPQQSGAKTSPATNDKQN
jgi:general secretion pathway protein D